MKRTLLLISLTGFLFNGCKNDNNEKINEPDFIVIKPLQSDTLIYKDYVGQINAMNHIEMRSQEKGYLEKIFVDEGQFVKKGQPMFKIMPIIYEAEMEKAKANLSYAEIEYQNTRRLADSNIVSKNELALSKANLDKERAELGLAKAHLEFTMIKAPFDGMMDRFYQRPGSLVDEGELLTTLSDNSKMWVYFNVPEVEYLDYTKSIKKESNQTVLLRMANGDIYPHEGKIETIEADFNNETGNIAFRATFPNPERILRHGETGTILISSPIKNAIIIPQKSTFDILDKKYVYVVDASGTLKANQITIGAELPHIYIVSSGLSPEDQILFEGLGKVKNNEKIKFTIVPNKQAISELNNLHAE